MLCEICKWILFAVKNALVDHVCNIDVSHTRWPVDCEMNGRLGGERPQCSQVMYYAAYFNSSRKKNECLVVFGPY